MLAYICSPPPCRILNTGIYLGGVSSICENDTIIKLTPLYSISWWEICWRNISKSLHCIDLKKKQAFPTNAAMLVLIRSLFCTSCIPQLSHGTIILCYVLRFPQLWLFILWSSELWRPVIFQVEHVTPCSGLKCFTLKSWKWREHILPKRRYTPIKLHGVKTYKTKICTIILNVALYRQSGQDSN